MEFPIGRSLASNVSNLLLDPAMLEACREKNVDWYELLDQEPDAGLGNGSLGRLAACFVESTATMDLPSMGYGLRYEYGIFKQAIRDGWQNEKPDNASHPDPWEVVRLGHLVEVQLSCSFQIRVGALVPSPASLRRFWESPLTGSPCVGFSIIVLSLPSLAGVLQHFHYKDHYSAGGPRLR
jgi:starch phosphorylase